MHPLRASFRQNAPALSITLLLCGLLWGLTACPPPCPQNARPRCASCPPGAQRPPAKTPDCTEMCTYFTYCRARRWTAPAHVAKLIQSCVTQCKVIKPGTDAAKIFNGIKTCSVNRSCVGLVDCLESLEAKMRAAKPKPDPNAIYKVEVAGSPSRGPKGALVTVVMFSNHECGFCRRAATVVDDALKKHPQGLRLVYKHFPLSANSGAMLSARAASCVLKTKDVAAFWAFHAKAMATSELGEKAVLTMAKAAGADPKRVAACLKSKGGLGAVTADLKLGEALGVDGTPAFYFNGKHYSGYLDPAAFQAAFDEAKGRAEAARSSGVKPAQVYQHLTGKGATKLQYLPTKRPAPRPAP